MTAKKHGIGRPLAALSALLVCACIVLFSKWLGLRILALQWDASLWKVGKLFSDIADKAAYYSVDELSVPVTWVCILLYTMLAVTLITIFISAKSAIASYKWGEDISTAGFWGMIVLSVIIILTVAIFNSVIEDKTGGWFSDVLVLTTAPFLSIFFSIVGIVCCKRIPADALSEVHIPDFKLDSQTVTNTVNTVTQKANDYAQTVKSSAQAFKSAAQATIAQASAAQAAATQPTAPQQPAAGLCCVHCGAQVTDTGYQFCPSCGKKLIKARFCEECGCKLGPDMAFCPQCGKKIKTEL